MAEYKFRVEQMVHFKAPKHTASARGPYKITQRLPISDSELQYRIKSQYEEYERVAKESELSPV
jgi:hypothetical protein